MIFKSKGQQDKNTVPNPNLATPVCDSSLRVCTSEGNCFLGTASSLNGCVDGLSTSPNLPSLRPSEACHIPLEVVEDIVLPVFDIVLVFAPAAVLCGHVFMLVKEGIF